MGDATRVYKMNCFLMFALAIHTGISSHNYYREWCGEDLTDIAMSWYIPASKYLLTFALVCYVVHITRKVLNTKRIY